MSATSYGGDDTSYRTHVALEKNEVFTATEVDDRFIRYDHENDDVVVVEDVEEQEFTVYEDGEEPVFDREDAEEAYRTVAGFEYAGVAFEDVLREFEGREDFDKVSERYMPPEVRFEYAGEDPLEVSVDQDGVYLAVAEEQGADVDDVDDLREGLVFKDFFAHDPEDDDAEALAEIELDHDGEMRRTLDRLEGEFWEDYGDRLDESPV